MSKTTTKTEPKSRIERSLTSKLSRSRIANTCPCCGGTLITKRTRIVCERCGNWNYIEEAA